MMSESAFERAKSELRNDLQQPYDKSQLAHAAGLTKEQWDRAVRESEKITETSAIWTLKLQALRRYKDKSSRKSRSWTILRVCIVATIGGLLLSYVGASENTFRRGYGDFFNYDTDRFAVWFAVGAVLGVCSALAYIRLPSAQRREGTFAAIAGASLGILASYGPGHRGILYWLAHGGVIRITIGVVAAMLVFEIWRQRQR